VKAVVSLGSNLGDRRRHLASAVEMLGSEFPVQAVSPLYETAPVGVTDQSPFLNQVAVVDVDDAEQLLAAAHRAEDARGRLRSVRWGPRTLDVDLVTVDALTLRSPRLTLPHPRAHERAFVLVPWLDVEPDAELVGFGPVRRLVQLIGTDGIRRWAS
jgi:2-amino-4-hydroxy-6-hydroxymethyldihydropteridine diphosphokinase